MTYHLSLIPNLKKCKKIFSIKSGNCRKITLDKKVSLFPAINFNFNRRKRQDFF